MLYNKINQHLKQAMLAKDIKTANAIRVIKSRISEYLVQHRLPRDNIEDDIVLTVLASYKKGLQKAIEQLAVGGQKANQLISEYKEEIVLCDQYLPNESQAKEQIAQIVDRAVTELGASSSKQVGQVVGHIMKNNKRLDGKLVKELVTQKLRS